MAKKAANSTKKRVTRKAEQKVKTVKIPSDLYKSLKKISKEQHKSVDKFLHELLLQAAGKSPEVQKIVRYEMPKDEGIPYEGPLPGEPQKRVEYEWSKPEKPPERVIIKPAEQPVEQTTSSQSQASDSSQSISPPSQSHQPSYKINGVVLVRGSNEKRVSGVVLKIVPSNDVARTVTTNDNGYWEVNGLTAISVEVRAADQLGFRFDPSVLTLSSLHPHGEILAIPIASTQSETQSNQSETPKTEAPKTEPSKSETQSGQSTTSSSNINNELSQNSIPLGVLKRILQQLNVFSNNINQWLRIRFGEQIMIASIIQANIYTSEYVKIVDGGTNTGFQVITSVPVLLNAINQNSNAVIAHFVRKDVDFFVEFFDAEYHKITEADINVDIIGMPKLLYNATENLTTIGTMKADDYNRLIYSTSYAADSSHGGIDDGIDFEISESKMIATATNKEILASNSCAFNASDDKNYGFELPLASAKGWREILSSYDHADLTVKAREFVEFTLENKAYTHASIIEMTLPDNLFFISETFVESFYNWHKIIPDEQTIATGPILFSVKADDLYTYVNKIALDIQPDSENRKAIDIYIGAMPTAGLTVKPAGNRENIFPLQFTAISMNVYAFTKMFKIRVKAPYLLEPLETFGTKEVWINFSGEHSAITILSKDYFEDGDKQIAVFMPLKTNPEDWTDDLKNTEENTEEYEEYEYEDEEDTEN